MLLPRLLLACSLAAALAACSTAEPASTAAPTADLAPIGVAPTAPVSSAAAAVTRLAAVPTAGTVTYQAGPFDDRLRLAGTSLRRGVVRTSLSVTSDVSEIIVLETQSDFYDAAGALLGSVRTQHEDEHGAGQEHEGDEAVELVMAAPPAWAATVHSAVLSVPVLVNE